MNKLLIMLISTSTLCACGHKTKDSFPFSVERFADVEVLRYRVDGFDSLSVAQKEMLYYLHQAALQGRDILFDQHGKWNLPIRRTLEAVYIHYTGDKTSEEFKNMELYLKQVWFANGIHHHYSGDKFTPKFSQAFFAEALRSIDPMQLPLRQGEGVDELIATLTPIIFDPAVDAKASNQAANEDLLLTSANNYYDGVSQAEAEAFYGTMKRADDATPLSYGLNSRLVKRNGKLVEEVYKIGGRYTQALERVVYWLEKAAAVAENPAQKAHIDKLIEFNRTGDLNTFDQYAILWVKDTLSTIDFVNGFTETYGDPLGLKASWESLVNFRNEEASRRTLLISENAQWFEDHSPISPAHKKERVVGVSAKVITAATLAGDCYPATPIGINLPNADWIRRDHGSKSVTIENITYAYDQASLGNGFSDEFILGDTERDLVKKYGFITGNLEVDLHECLGHGSGKLLPGVDGDALRAYGSVIEETRADLFALYYLADAKLVELGLLPNAEAYKAEYYKYILNGAMTQLTRIKPGKNIEQAHMRNRQTIAMWLIERARKSDRSVEMITREGRSYIVINDYAALRRHIGELLAEVQRIKSTGDYQAAKELIEGYGVKVNPSLHQEVLARYASLDIAPYRGFINPIFTPVTDDKGKIIDVTLDYTEGYTQQMLRYARDYSPLPSYND